MLGEQNAELTMLQKLWHHLSEVQEAKVQDKVEPQEHDKVDEPEAAGVNEGPKPQKSISKPETNDSNEQSSIHPAHGNHCMQCDEETQVWLLRVWRY